mmetsp:Transcript_54996/g.103028  ORF Transcript_54996/g.103028 Transcript_54996/m.103028 type:complete len:283 (-) Transcript_54996:229-1077(-)
MGTKASFVYFSLLSIGLVFQFISIFVRWHVLNVNPLGFTIFKMKTGLIYTRVDEGLTLLCELNTKYTQCKDMADGILLQDASHEWCIPALTRLKVTAPCDGFSSAYIMGLACICVVGLNVLLLGAASSLLLQYFGSSKHKPEYRQWAFLLHSIATAILLATFLAWSFHTLPALDHIGGQLKKLVSPGLGVSYGYFLMVIGILFQSIAAGLFSFMPLGNEMTEDERMSREFAKEQAKLAAMGQRAGVPPHGYGATSPAEHPYGHYGAPPGPAFASNAPAAPAW